MVTFTDDCILKLDERYAMEGIPFHARPLQAAIDILGDQFVMGIGGNPQVEEITSAYERLIPEVTLTWPGMGTGLVASIDRIRKVTVGVTFGSPFVSLYEGLDFSNETEWAIWCRKDHKIMAKSAYAFGDMHDLVYGIDDFRFEAASDAFKMWALAAGQLKLIAESLSQSGAISSAILQPICLTAELAIKGTLLNQGLTEKELKNSKLFGHNLTKLAKAMCSQTSHRDDELLLAALSKFPDYVGGRYQETTLTRLEVIDLAVATQFVAASSVRRVSERDLTGLMEKGWPGPRTHFFSYSSHTSCS